MARKSDFSSFVFPETTKKQIDAMPTAEMKLKYYTIVSDYGMYNIEPDNLSEMENLIWIPMRDLIDHCRKSHGGAPENNQNACKNKQNNLNNQNNVVFNETIKTTFINDNDNLNDNHNHNLNVNDNDNGEGEEKEKEQEKQNISLSPEPCLDINIPKDYAKQVFDILKDNNLPCCLGNYISFMQSDFKFALETLHSRADLRGLHSDMVLGALNNYALVINNPNTWQGWKNKKSFDRFVSWERFKDFLPDRFCLDNFLDRSTPQPKQAQNQTVGINRALEILREVQNDQR